MSTSSRGWRFVIIAALRAIWSRRLVAAAVALAVCAAVFAVESFRGHEYTSQAVIQVRGVDEAAARPSGGWLPVILGELDSRSLSREAADRAGWSGTREDFARSLELEPSGSELRVSFSGSDPEMAAGAANAYAAAFVEEVERLGGERLAGGSLGAQAGIERSANAAEVPAMRPLVAGLAALAPGLAAGAGVALALAVRRRHWRGAREAEFVLGAPVLGVVPELDSVSRSGEDAVDRKL